jgi:hypothetical protein
LDENPKPPSHRPRAIGVARAIATRARRPGLEGDFFVGVQSVTMKWAYMFLVVAFLPPWLYLVQRSRFGGASLFALGYIALGGLVGLSALPNSPVFGVYLAGLVAALGFTWRQALGAWRASRG